MGDDGVVSKKRKEQEMVVEGNHEIAEMQKQDLTVLPHTAPAQEQANKMKSKPAVKARQLFDADDDDGEDNMDESESADDEEEDEEEEEVEDRVVASHDMVVEAKEHLKMAEKGEFAVTQRKSSRLAATARGSSKTQISRDSADNDASLFTPPRPRRRASSKVKISPSSPPGLSAQPSLMDVVEPSQPLPSLTARESYAYMDMDDSYQMKRKASKNRRYSDPSQDISLRSAPSSMKGVTEYHSEPSGHVGMELSAEHGAEGGEGMAVVTSPPPPHFEPPQIVYEVNPIAPLYDPEPPVTYEASRTPLGRLGVGSGQGSLQRTDTLTPSIDITQLRVIQTIGSGSCGEVYKATWLGLTVAVKKVFRSLIHENALKEFQAECNIMKRLRHPNIVLFLGITKSGEDDSASNGAMNGMADAGSIKLGQSNALLFSDSLMCLVTEFMPLGSLHDVLMNPKTSVDLMAILKMATDAAMGVNYLHQFSPPIIHRDLKSHNLLVGDNFMVKVTDFGLAKLTTSRDDAHNTFCGTLPWAAPEVLSGAGYTVKADVYSFGVVLWELLTRQEPYKGLHKPDIIVGVVNNNLRPPLFPDMEPLVVELIEACWAQNPEDRPEFQQIVDRLTEVTDYLYSLHQQRKALGPSSMASHGGELHYGSKWLAEHAPGNLDHHQQVALAQAAAQAGAAPDSTAMLSELEHGVGIHQGQLGGAGPVDSAGAGHGSSPSHSGRISNVSSTETILKNQREALESMNAALEAGDMAQVCAAMAQMKAAVESASRFPAFTVSNGSGASAHQHQNGGASGPSSQHNSTASLNSSKKIGQSWTLDLNELTSIAKLPEEPSPSFSNRGQIGKPGDTNQSSLTLSGTTNVMAHSEPEEQKACTAWHGEFRGQDVLVRVWHDALEASEVAEFHKQLNILSSVRSPRIAIFYGCVLEPRLLMVTEFTPNPSLYSLMIADPTTVIFDWDIVMTVALEIAKAISALHQWKPSIVHRDIQSSKFIVDQRTWTVKMNDLGLARFHNGSNQSTLAKMKGNFLYTAPETYSGTAYSTQSDIYSFGIVLWELVTRCVAGQYVMPFSECTNIKFEFQLVLQISKDNIRPSLHPDTPEPLSQLITSCWNADPLQRPAITDVVDQLERLRELYLQETQKQRQDMPAAM
jgi:serine/threonine protein kinase